MKTRMLTLSQFSFVPALTRIGTLILILSACLVSTGLAQAQLPQRQIKRVPSFPRTPDPAQIPRLQRAQTPRLPASASRNIIPALCPPDAIALDPAVSCGYVPVPLERKYPTEEKINIYFEVYPHTNAGPAESAIVPNLGGPGPTTTGNRGLWLGTFGPNLDAHDLLLIDDRGRGLSGTIGISNCQDLQHGTAPSFDQALAECAAQLGDDNSRYGTGDIALDVEAVRAALGYDKLDYYGGSNGGVDAIAYATRFGEHLRSVVLASPNGPPGLVPFSAHFGAFATLREVRVDCLRSPACSIDHPNPDIEWEKLIQAIRKHPLDGNAYDASGNLKSVHFDESVLLTLSSGFPTGGYVDTGEFLAAAASLEHGDPGPLLRLGAEGYFPLLGDYGDPTIFSFGAANATYDVDSQMPFDWSVPPPVRLQQLEEAVSDLPSDYFYPFSKAAATSIENTQGAAERDAIFWEEASPPAPVVPAGATYPNVPTLAMVSDIEAVAPIELASKVAALFPESTLVIVAGGQHESAISGNQCALGLTVQFIETLKVGDTSCAGTPETIWPAVGRFPLLAQNARPAEIDPNGVNEIGTAERKVVTVAVAAATDAVQRITFFSSSGDGVGLRGGTFHTDFGSTALTITLTNCAFANDVIVNGAVVLGNSFQADLTVSGAGTAGGILHVEGMFQAPGPVGEFKISGLLGGKRVAVLVPEA